jgi:hypothetical protein
MPLVRLLLPRRTLFTLIIASTLTMTLLPAYFQVGEVFGEEGTGHISVTGSPVSLTALAIAASSDPTGNVTGVDVDVWYLWKVTVSDPDGMSDIGKVALYVHKDGAPKGVWGVRQSQGALWTGIGDRWLEPDFAGVNAWQTAAEYMNPSQSSHPLLDGGTSGTWVFSLKLRSLSHYTANGGWLFDAIVRDKGGNTDRKVMRFDVNLHVALTIPASISWAASPTSANVTASNQPAVTTYTGNAKLRIRMRATDPVNQFGDTFPASNIYVGQTGNVANNDGVKLSSVFKDFGTELSDAESAAVGSYWFVTVPAGQPTGTYTFTYSVEMAFSSFGSTTPLEYALLFSEPFNSFNASRWVIANWAPRCDPANVAVEAGNLKIKVRPDRAGGEAYTTSTYQYGSFRARIKISPNSGVHSALFLYDVATENEIDVELTSTTGKILFVTWDAAIRSNRVELPLSFDPSAEFHEYRIDWYYGIVDFYVDDALAYSFFDAPTNALTVRINSWSPTWLPPPSADSFSYADALEAYAIQT